jgi:hypothetical protein
MYDNFHVSAHNRCESTPHACAAQSLHLGSLETEL